MKKTILFLLLSMLCIALPIYSTAAASMAAKSSLDNMTVSDYLKLYYSDKPTDTQRVRGILDDTENWLIAADVFSREIQGKPLFCANAKDDPINLDIDTFNSIIMANLSRLDVYNNILSIKDVLPFTYYVLGVMEMTFPCKEVKSHFDLFGRIEKSYLQAKNQQRIDNKQSTY